MALVTCYDTDGNPHEKEPVDARECVAQCGYSMTPPKVGIQSLPDGSLSAELHGVGSGDALPPIEEKQKRGRKAAPVAAE